MHKTEFPNTVDLLDNSTFMDEFAADAEKDVSVTALYYELIYLMNKILLHMAKWAKNSKHLKEVYRTKGVDFKEVTKNLESTGTPNWTHFQWIPVMSPANTLKTLPQRGKSCKLRPDFIIPLAYYSLYRLFGKLSFQDTWCRGLTWDEILLSDLGAY